MAGHQPPVHPDRVSGGAAAAELVTGGTLHDLGDHLIGQCYQVPNVGANLA
jgi:hypothetical protein